MNPATTHLLTGGGAVAEMFRRHDVGPIFGMGGFQLLPFYDAVRRNGMTHILIDDERSGAFAADAWARVTGRPGTCDATLGPGATNLVTALVESLNAGTPLVALVGDSHRAYAGNNMTQETRQTDILRPACKELIRVELIERIPEHVRRAFAVASAGRPGPVVLVLPEDVSHDEHEFAESDLWIDVTPSEHFRGRPNARAVTAAASLLRDAERPLILAGGGIHLSGAYAPLLELAERYGIPVAHTLSGKGAIPCTHPRSAGVFGRYSRIANELIEKSDCLLVVGCKLGEIATKRYTLPSSNTPLIHLDVLPEEIGRWARTTVALVGDASAGLDDLLEALGSSSTPGSDPLEARAAYLDEVEMLHDVWRRSVIDRYTSAERPINVARLVGELNNVMPEDGILVADGGFASHWAGLLFDTRRAGRQFVADRGFASIGYGLPGSLGAALGSPGSPVVGLTGDGGLNMSLGGLETARRAGAPFTLVVVNNAASGYVKALQHAVYGEGAYQSSDLLEVDYAAVADAFGCAGVRVEDPDELGPVLERAIARRDVPTVVDVVVTRDPAHMLPGVDSRTGVIRRGDRPA